nr:hypothetical protein [Tanacetum cinerariifolium]
NFESKHPERLLVANELYRCGDPVYYLRKEFDCLK